MAKRFTDSDLFKKKFIRGLEGAYKLLWIYIQHDCDHAGIWEVDIEIACIKIGYNVTEEDAIKNFGSRIVLVENGDKWFIPSFIEFQYGVLNADNRAHNSVINILQKHGIKGLRSSLQGGKDMDKDKKLDKVKDKDKGARIEKFAENVNSINNVEFILNSKQFVLFLDYWTENGEKDKKCRWEKQNVFDIKKRLVRWSNNNKSVNNHGQQNTGTHQDVNDELEWIKLQQSGNQ